MDIKLDKTDRQILNMLQRDGKVTTKELSEKLELTPTPIYERVRKLEREKVIDRYVALVNEKKLGIKLTAFIFISLKNHTRSYLESFIKDMEKLDQVLECYHVAGNFDFFLKVATKDMDDYEAFLLTKLSVINNLAHVQSTFVLSKNKHSTAYKISG